MRAHLPSAVIIAALFPSLGYAQICTDHVGTENLDALSMDVLGMPTPTWLADDDAFGTEVVDLGDINGDGLSDFAVGAPFQQQANGTKTGAVGIYFGVDRFASNNTADWGNPDVRITGMATPIHYKGFGTGIASSDLNCDGQPDLVIGAPGSGSVLVWNGVPAAGTYDADTADVVYQFAFSGGEAVASLPDRDGTVTGAFTCDDLAVGVPKSNAGGNRQGSVYFVNGSSSFFTRPPGSPTGPLFRSAPPERLDGDHDKDELGRALAGGDIDGDGRGDLVMGASRFAGGRGIAYAVLGTNPLIATTVETVADRTWYDNSSIVLKRRVGSSVAIGHVTGGPTNNVIVGARGKAGAAGSVFVLPSPLPPSGPITIRASATLVPNIAGALNIAGLGRSVASGKDLDGDGLHEVLAGGNKLVSGDGGAYLFDGATIAFGGTVNAMARFDTLGNSDFDEGVGSAVALLGDIDGNSIPDLGIGAPGRDVMVFVGGSPTLMPDHGGVFLVSGQAAVGTLYTDLDSDGYGQTISPVCDAGVPQRVNTGFGDCDDTNANVGPGFAELCDGLDNDCNSIVDDNTTSYQDLDGDGFGDVVLASCAGVDIPGDCNDADASINPDATEVCNSGVDDDCDGLTDDDDPTVDPSTTSVFDADADADAFTDPLMQTQACIAPFGYAPASAVPDCDDFDRDVNPGQPELCSTAHDDNCDGLANDADPTTPMDATLWFVDADGDGFGTGAGVLACVSPPGRAGATGDCAPLDPAINPDADELCAVGDENCDGLDGAADPNVTDAPTWWADTDGDAFGDPAASTVACVQQPGTVPGGDPNDPTVVDCDPGDAAVNPAAIEVCNGIDDDCDGDTDDEDSSLDVSTYPVSYVDDDGDGFGPDASANQPTSCIVPAGRVEHGGDCDDDPSDDNDFLTANGMPYRAAAANNPDGHYYLDADEDGYGAGAAIPFPDCASQATLDFWSVFDGDCLDSAGSGYTGAEAAAIHPDATYYTGDVDGDGWAPAGASSTTPASCRLPLPGESFYAGDCLDTTDSWSSTVYPGSVEDMTCGAPSSLDFIPTDCGMSAIDGSPVTAGGVDLADKDISLLDAGAEGATAGMIQPSSTFGGDRAEFGDLNGDGFDDMVLANLADDLSSLESCGSGSGAVDIFFGNALGVWNLDQPSVTISTTRTSTCFGKGLAVLPDINNDGKDELFIGEPGFNQNNKGRGFLFCGATVTSSSSHTDADYDHRFEQGAATQFFGWSATAYQGSAGNTRLAIGSPGLSNNVNGFVHVLPATSDWCDATPSATVFDQDANPAYHLIEGDGEWLGYALAGGGRYTQGGSSSQLVIGGPVFEYGTPGSTANRGRVVVVDGPFTLDEHRILTASAPTGGLAVQGDVNNQRVGVSVDAVTGVAGGCRRFIFGSMTNEAWVSRPTTCIPSAIYEPGSASLPFATFRKPAGTLFGRTVAVAGTTNGSPSSDETDFLIGDPGDRLVPGTGTVSLVRASSACTGIACELTGSPAAWPAAADVHDFTDSTTTALGSALAGGDFDNDGFDDLLLAGEDAAFLLRGGNNVCP